MLRAVRMVMLSRYCLADASRHRMTNGDDDVRDVSYGRVTALPISYSSASRKQVSEDEVNLRIESNNLIMEFNADSKS